MPAKGAVGRLMKILVTGATGFVGRAGQRVFPARAEESGYAFRHPRLEEALRASL